MLRIMFVTSNGYNKVSKEGIYSPITQNQRHMELIKAIRAQSKGNILTKVLFEKNFYNNYHSIVVLANPKTVLNDKYAKNYSYTSNSPKDIFLKVFCPWYNFSVLETSKDKTEAGNAAITASPQNAWNYLFEACDSGCLVLLLVIQLSNTDII